MRDLPKSEREFYESQSKEQLIIFLLNADYEKKLLHEKLALLTGCGCFGDCDGMNGSCIYCYEENKALHMRCLEFQSERYKQRNKG